jgi:sugar phosphate isomerase/epimerase
MRFGICVYKDDIPAAEWAGYDYVEHTVTNVLPEIEDSEFKKLKEQLNTYRIRPEAWRRFILPNLPVVGPEVDFPAIAEFLRITLVRIRELSGDVVVFGSPLSRNIPEDFSRDKACEQIVRFLQISGDIARSHDLVVVIEPIIRKNCNLLNTVAEALSMAREVARPEIKVQADLFHMAGNDEQPQAVEQAGDSLFHIHMPVPEIPGLNEPRAINTILPDYPTGEFLQSLHNMGYDHRLSIEDLDRNFMNLEREAPLVLSHVQKAWEGLSA